MTHLTGSSPRSAEQTTQRLHPSARLSPPQPSTGGVGDETGAERNALRLQIEAQRRQLSAASERLHALEQVARAVRASRGYRLMRRLGRWQGVEQTLEQLLGPADAPDRGEAAVEPSADLVGLSHNVPGVLLADVGFVAAFRIRNRGRTPVFLPAQHTLFWRAASPVRRYSIAIELDGRLLLHAQVADDRVAPCGSTVFFFPLQPGPEGAHRLQVVLTAPSDGHGGGADRQLLFDVAFRVEQAMATPGPMARLWSLAFMLRHAETPRLAARVRCWRARLASRLAADPDRRLAHLRRLKDENRRLALLEKQMRADHVASRPCYLTVDTTVDCNLRCPLCYREDAAASAVLPAEPHMTKAVVDEVIRALFPTAYTISPSGWGEPLLSPHIDTLIEACRRHGVLMSFTTNGVLLNKKGLLERLVPVLHWLEISVDSVNPETFNRLRAGARFEQVLANARAVGRIRAQPGATFNFGFSMTLFHDNLQEIPAMLRLVADCGGNFLKTDIGVIFNRGQLQHSVVRSPQAYNTAYEEAQQCASDLGLNLFMRAPFVGDDRSEASRYGVCDYLYTQAAIATDGSFKPCYSLVLPPRPAGGTLDLQGLWNSADMRRLRRDHDTPRGSESCRKCYMTLRGRDSLARRQELFIRCDVEGSR